MVHMLRFPLGPIPVRVHFSFALIALLAYPTLQGQELIPWTAAVFLAVLLHEAGHAFTANAYGADGISITLFALGGFTTYLADPPLSPGRRFFVAAAGSGVGIIAGGGLLLAVRAGLMSDVSRLAQIGINGFIFASLVWGVLNWVPIRPLDGGQMMTSFLQIVVPQYSEAASKVITVVVGAAAVLVAISFDQLFAAAFVVYLVIMGVRSPTSESISEEPTSRERGRESTPPDFPI